MNLTEIPEILSIIKNQVFDKLEMDFANLIKEKESTRYAAYRFKLGTRKVIFRNAKITPTKTGQFVTLWKRDENGLTQPYGISDNFDFMIINVGFEDRFGQFVFPKSVLLQQGIISNQLKQGKRAIRVYPVWDTTHSRQAQLTQKWQLEHFIEMANDKSVDLEAAKKLYFSG